MNGIINIFAGKLTYTALLVVLINSLFGVTVSDGDVQLVLDQVQTIINAVALLVAIFGRWRAALRDDADV